MSPWTSLRLSFLIDKPVWFNMYLMGLLQKFDELVKLFENPLQDVWPSVNISWIWILNLNPLISSLQENFLLLFGSTSRRGTCYVAHKHALIRQGGFGYVFAFSSCLIPSAKRPTHFILLLRYLSGVFLLNFQLLLALLCASVFSAKTSTLPHPAPTPHRSSNCSFLTSPL